MIPPAPPIQPPYPRNVPLLKAALMSIDDVANRRTTIPFQYNPASLRRSVRPNTVGAGEGDRSAEVRFTGAAAEIIQLEAHLDAIDQLNKSHPTVNEYGIYPLLSALQQLLYPTVQQVTTYNSKLSQGSIDVVPPEAPRLVFVWGRHRVVPVRLTNLAITEELYDGNLSPISASVALEMRVMTYSDVFPSNPDYSLFLSHQKNMETMASWVQPSDAKELIGIDVNALKESTPSRS